MWFDTIITLINLAVLILLLCFVALDTTGEDLASLKEKFREHRSLTERCLRDIERGNKLRDATLRDYVKPDYLRVASPFTGPRYEPMGPAISDYTYNPKYLNVATQSGAGQPVIYSDATAQGSLSRATQAATFCCGNPSGCGNEACYARNYGS